MTESSINIEGGICGQIAPYATPGGNPVACAWPKDHDKATPHSWADLPTVLVTNRAHSDHQHVNVREDRLGCGHPDDQYEVVPTTMTAAPSKSWHCRRCGRITSPTQSFQV